MLKFDDLQDFVNENVAIRAINKLEPAGGPHSKVFPPTYKGGVYAIEERLISGTKTTCVLLDSVASQANRMEESLQNAYDSGDVKLPLAVIDFSGCEEVRGSRITSLQAPHRIADALFRECTYEGDDFRKSDVGKSVFGADSHYATPLFETCPTALLFGMWDSTGPEGGLGNKFERAITSEIVGINSVFGVGTSSRIDPVIRKTENTTIYELEDGGWTLDENKAVKDDRGKPKKYQRGEGPKKKGKLSAVNLGNVAPTVKEYRGNEPNDDVTDPLTRNKIKKGDILSNGATVEYAEQTCVISLAALRKLHFPPNAKTLPTNKRDGAARSVLAALGLLAFTLSTHGGLDLRSGCVLQQAKSTTWDVLGASKNFILDKTEAMCLFKESVDRAAEVGVSWETKQLTLSPTARLLEAIEKSKTPSNDDG